MLFWHHMNQTKCCSIDCYCHYSATKYSENLACETEYYFGRNVKILKELYKFEVYLNFYVYIKKLNGLKFVIKHILFINAVIKNHTTFWSFSDNDYGYSTCISNEKMSHCYIRHEWYLLLIIMHLYWSFRPFVKSC